MLKHLVPLLIKVGPIFPTLSASRDIKKQSQLCLNIVFKNKIELLFLEFNRYKGNLVSQPHKENGKSQIET